MDGSIMVNPHKNMINLKGGKFAVPKYSSIRVMCPKNPLKIQFSFSLAAQSAVISEKPGFCAHPVFLSFKTRNQAQIYSEEQYVLSY